MLVFPVSRSASLPLFSRAFNSSLGELLSRQADAGSRARNGETPQLVPQMDVSETDTAYTIVLTTPGVSREQLKVSVEGRRVSVEAEAAAPAAVEGQRTLYTERAQARYARTVALPSEVDQASSQAKLENGVLTLTLVKKVPTGATQLSIN